MDQIDANIEFLMQRRGLDAGGPLPLGSIPWTDPYQWPTARNEATRPSESGCESLIPSVDGDGNLTVTPGLVTGMMGFADGTTYDGMPLMGATRLDNDPPPSMAYGGTKVWLKIIWVPEAGGEAGFYHPDGGKIYGVLVIEDDAPENVDSEVDVDTGEATVNGEYHYLIASSSGGVLTSIRCGSRDVVFCGTNDVRAIWSGP